MNVELACSTVRRLRGLLGRKELSDVLVLAPCNDVHTFGMRRPIDIAFISVNGTVLESHRAIGAFRRFRCKEAVATLERFASSAAWFESGDSITIMPERTGEKGDAL